MPDRVEFFAGKPAFTGIRVRVQSTWARAMEVEYESQHEA